MNDPAVVIILATLLATVINAIVTFVIASRRSKQEIANRDTTVAITSRELAVTQDAEWEKFKLVQATDGNRLRDQLIELQKLYTESALRTERERGDLRVEVAKLTERLALQTQQLESLLPLRQLYADAQAQITKLTEEVSDLRKQVVILTEQLTESRAKNVALETGQAVAQAATAATAAPAAAATSGKTASTSGTDKPVGQEFLVTELVKE